jgi:reverse gyrase
MRHCERCGGEIPAERIEAMPETRICVGCSREIGGEFEVRMVQTSLGKTGSLKKNYGDVSIVKKRKRIEPKPQ